MKLQLALAAAGLSLAVAGCGTTASGPAPIAVERVADEQARPAPSTFVAALAGIAYGQEARTRLGYVDVAASEALRPDLSPARVRRLVLGEGSTAPSPETERVVQVGDHLSVLLSGSGREVVGHGGEARGLAATTPERNVLQDDAVSAVQSCLGTAAAGTIVGPRVMGLSSAVGASVLDDGDPPSGPKLRICGAPRHLRAIDRGEHRLERLFPATDLPADRRPVIALGQLGEREILTGTIALDQVDDALLDDLLAGGPRLRAIVDPGESNGEPDDLREHNH